ncbi:MAG: Wzz/FepE/Etk N-terminal domain-containing protein [Sciscionella sp.]
MPRDDLQAVVVTHAIRRQMGLIAGIVVLFAAIAGAYAFLRPQSYTASARVLITPLTGNALTTGTTDTSQNITVAMQTEASLVNSVAVTERVNDALKSSLKTSSSTVAASVPTNTQLIEITYSAKSRTNAQRYAEAYAEAYLNQRTQLALATQQGQLTSLNKQVASVTALLTNASALAKGPHPPADAATKVQLYATTLATLQADIGQAQSLVTSPGEIIVPAPLPPKTGPLLHIAITIGGGLLGLIVALVIATWRERRDDRIQSGAEAAIGGLPVLATVPTRARKRAVDQLDGERDEAFRRARIGILAASRGNSVIALSGLSSSEPCAEVAVRLARSLAAAGYRVVLVDAAIDDAKVGRLMGIPPMEGLSDRLISGEHSDIKLTEVDGVRVLTAGRAPLDARERYSGAAIGEVLAGLRADSDYVLLTSSPATTADGLAVVLGSDSVALVATDHATTREQIADAHDLIRRLGADVLGLIVMLGGRRRPAAGRASSADSPPTDPDAHAEGDPDADAHAEGDPDADAHAEGDPDADAHAEGHLPPPRGASARDGRQAAAEEVSSPGAVASTKATDGLPNSASTKAR